VQNGW